MLRWLRDVSATSLQARTLSSTMVVVLFMLGKSSLSRFGVAITSMYSAMLLAFLVVVWWLFVADARFSVPKARDAPAFAVFAFLAIAIAATIRSPIRDYAFRMYALPLSVLTVCVALLYTKARTIADFEGVVGGHLLMLLLMLLPAVLGLGMSISSFTRFSVLGGGPIVFGRLMLIGYLSAVYFYRTRGNRVFLVFGALFVLMVVISGSKGPLVSLVLVMAIQFLVSDRPIWLKVTVIVLLVAIGSRGSLWILELLALQFPIVNRYKSLLNVHALLNATSSTIRTRQWTDAWGMFLQHPVLGSGPAGYHHEFNLGYPHNIFLELLAEYGFVVTILFGGSLVFPIRAFIRVWRRSSDKSTTFRELAMFFLLSFVTYAMNAQVSGYLVDNRFVFFYGLLLIRMDALGDFSGELGKEVAHV